MSDSLAFLRDALGALESAALLRRPPAAGTLRPDLVTLCSNDYLGFASEPLGDSAGAVRAGAGASPLVVGTYPEHLAAELAIADWVGEEAATLFSSGYAANVGAIAALVGPEDAIISDRLNHASIIDGCRLSRARIEVVPHRSVSEVGRCLARLGSVRRRLVVTESYFSMDGDSPNLVELRGLCDRFRAILMVDEAHALGVFGPEGRGLCAESGVRPDVLVGTLGKAVGLQGAFVAGSNDLRAWLWNRARSLVFSTAISPAVASAVPARIRAVRTADALRARVHEVAETLRGAVRSVGGRCSSTVGPIVPWIVGEPAAALRLSSTLERDFGIAVTAIRPPTVPPGSARLRLTANARLGGAEVSRAVAAIVKVGGAQ